MTHISSHSQEGHLLVHKVTKNPQFLLWSFPLYYVFLLYLSFISRIFGGDPGLQRKKYATETTKERSREQSFQFRTETRLGSETKDRLERSFDSCKHKIQEVAGVVEITSA